MTDAEADPKIVEEVRASAIPPTSHLSALQREFIVQFVATGGKPRRAAILAGYAPKSARISASKNLCNKHIISEIDRLCRINIRAALPIAIRTLVDVCANSTDPKARVMAANSLLDRSGLAAPKGGVQVNVGVQVNGGAAQRLIAEVWNARADRLSDIGAAMPDNLQAISDAIDAAAGDDPGGEVEGGGRLAGPAVPVPHLPPPSTAGHHTTTGAGPEAIARWTDAIGEGEE